MRRFAWLSVATLFALPAFAQWDITSDFSFDSNPAGQWCYGYKAAGDWAGPMTLFNLDFQGFGIQGWTIDRTLQAPSIFKNVSEGYRYGSFPGDIALRSGPANQIATIQWTPAEHDLYLVHGAFEVGDTGAVDCSVYVGQHKHSQWLATSTRQTFSFEFGTWNGVMPPVYVMVGNAGDFNLSTTPVTFSVVRSTHYAPNDIQVNLGRMTEGSLASLAEEDGDAATFSKFIVPNQAAPIIRFQLKGTLPVKNYAVLGFARRVKLLAAGRFDEEFEAFDWNANAYVHQVTNTLFVAAGWTRVIYDLGYPKERFLGPNGEVKLRLSIWQVGPSATSVPSVQYDFIRWVAIPS